MFIVGKTPLYDHTLMDSEGFFISFQNLIFFPLFSEVSGVLFKVIKSLPSGRFLAFFIFHEVF